MPTITLTKAECKTLRRAIAEGIENQEGLADACKGPSWMKASERDPHYFETLKLIKKFERLQAKINKQLETTNANDKSDR